jgi:hypothetical protein
MPKGQWQPKDLPRVTYRFLSRKQDNTPLQCREKEIKETEEAEETAEKDYT